MKFFGRMIPALFMAVVWSAVQFAGPELGWLKMVTDPATTALILMGALLWLDLKKVESKAIAAMLVAFVAAGTLLALGMFLPGVAVFLLAQAGFAVLSIWRVRSVWSQKKPQWLLTIPVTGVYVAVGGFTARMLMKSADQALLPALLAYVVVMVIMAVGAFAAAVTFANLRWGAAAFGALALFVSDGLLAENMFGGLGFPGLGHIIMGSYWIGLLGLVMSGPSKDSS